MKLFILFFISLFFKLNFQFCFAEIEKYAFERKLNNDKSPDFLLLNILTHPEHFIFPEQNSFYNKTDLIYAVGGFADSSIKFEDLREQIKERWEQIGGEQTEIVTLMSGIEKMFEKAKLEITEKLRATLLVLYSLGCKILEGKKSGYEVIFKTDKIFAYDLNDNFKKVLKVLSGLNPAKDTPLNELVENAELLDKLASIGSKVEIKYPKLNNEHISFALMIDNVGDAEKMSGQILTEIIDKIMHEVSGNEGGWGYVKSENDEIIKISKEELVINEEIGKDDKNILDENKEKMVIEDSKSDNILVKFWKYFKNVLTKFIHFFF
ncbi:unnamed protein product [Meloidogyne enterolobii]|uniref:Uncharacterized protein n=1 Tax=Meloidogyne enterolobii TaxID=390850 RepID=A0ACB0ZME7_MELEN